MKAHSNAKIVLSIRKKCLTLHAITQGRSLQSNKFYH